MYQLKGSCLALCLAASSACGGVLRQESRLVEVQASVRAAEKAGAAADPKAARLLRSARFGAMQSVSAADRGDARNADLFLQRAEADAELALQLARAAEEQRRARQAWMEAKP